MYVTILKWYLCLEGPRRFSSLNMLQERIRAQSLHVWDTHTHTHRHTHTHTLITSLYRCHYAYFTDKWNQRGLEDFPPLAFLLQRAPCSFFQIQGQAYLHLLWENSSIEPTSMQGSSEPTASLPGRLGEPIISFPKAHSQFLNCCMLHLLQVVNSCRAPTPPLSVPQSAQHLFVQEGGKQINPKPIICIGNTRWQSSSRYKTGGEKGI